MKSSNGSPNTGLLLTLLSELSQIVAAGLDMCKLQEQVSSLSAQVTALQGLYSELLYKVDELAHELD